MGNHLCFEDRVRQVHFKHSFGTAVSCIESHATGGTYREGLSCGPLFWWYDGGTKGTGSPVLHNTNKLRRQLKYFAFHGNMKRGNPHVHTSEPNRHVESRDSWRTAVLKLRCDEIWFALVV